MTLKTLLLGSAAAFAVVGGAQAADLSVAEPVESVKVCDAFAGGYWYIPGTDTCLKIGGLVQFDVNFFDEANTVYGYSHSANWDFITEAHLNATARSMTDFGELYGFMEFRAVTSNSSAAVYNNGNFEAYLDSAYLKLGGLLAGRTGSVYDYGGGFTFDGSDYDSDAAADQLRLSWAAAGFGFALGIEDPRDRFGSQLALHYSMPNIVAAITASQANWDGQLSAAYAETSAGSGFGAQAAITIKLDSIAAGDKLRLKAAWAESEVASFASSAVTAYAGGSVWSALASFQHFWSPQLSSAVTFDYENTDAFSRWQVYGNLVWAPVAGFSAGIEAGWTDAPSNTTADGAWHGKVRLVRSF